MYDHRNVEHSVLVDLLSNETVKLTHLLSQGKFDDDYNRCKLLIKALTEEINSRRNTNFTAPPDFLMEE